MEFGFMCGCGLNSQHMVWATQHAHVKGNGIGEEFHCDIHVSCARLWFGKCLN